MHPGHPVPSPDTLTPFPGSDLFLAPGPGLTTLAETTASNPILDANLRALARTCAALAVTLSQTQPHPGLAFVDTLEGAPAGVLTQWGLLGPGFGEAVERALCSRKRPLQEAAVLVEKVTAASCGIAVITGFACGYHVAEAARKLAHGGLVVVLETDLPLLRAVFERIDCTAWLEGGNVIILTDPADEGALAQTISGVEHLVGMGVAVIDHPPSKARLGPDAARFVDRFVAVAKAARTTLITTLAQSSTTLRNLTQNLDHYTAAPGIADLAGVCAGRPAVVVSAGPSLQRNMRLLAQPGIAERVVIIATQTTLKTLLAAGIRPHFVTALDFHEISGRFYQGLTEQDVQGIQLVVEPKVNPAVTSAFPGVIRCCNDPFLDELLGPDLARNLGTLPSGATVAHLAYYLARHLGCDPVAFIGQDLAFTDNLYYSAGAAIHDVWASELGPFTTLETREWERIARARNLLRTVPSHDGRPLYTDEQMSTYLIQFQRDFKIDAARGLTVIDATEGGAVKHGAAPMPLAEFLARYVPTEAPPIPNLLPASLPATAGSTAEPDDPVAHRRAVRQRVRDLISDVRRVRSGSAEAVKLLQQMLEHHADQPRVNTLISRLDALRARVTAIRPAFTLVERLNQRGVYNRVRTDRAIYTDSSLDPFAVQRRQIERDIANVDSIIQAADHLNDILDSAARALDGAPKVTREVLAVDAGNANADAHPAGPAPVIAVVACLSPDARDWASPLPGGRTALHLTLSRLLRSKRLDGCIVLASDPHAARAAAGDLADARIGGRPITFAPATRGSHLPADLLAAAAAISPDQWRGGPLALTCYDRVLPNLVDLFAAIDSAGLTTGRDAAAMLVGGHWGLLDPALCDQLIDRYREDPAGHRVTFSQAAPGLAGCVVDVKLLADLHRTRASSGVHCSIGGLLSYVPVAPAADPIARSTCVPVAPVVRDALISCELTPARCGAILTALQQAGVDPHTADAKAIAGALTADRLTAAGLPPQTLHLHQPADSVALQHAREQFTVFAGINPRASVMLNAGWSPTAATVDLVAHASSLGLAVCVRTALVTTPATVDALIAAGVAVITVDEHAADPAGWCAVTGRSEHDFRLAQKALEHLSTSRPVATGEDPANRWAIRRPIVIPRMARRDAILHQIEDWYDRSILRFGGAVIDPPHPTEAPSGLGAAPAAAGERLTALPLPALARTREALLVRPATPNRGASA